MKFSEQWLREWASPKISSKELVDQLTMAGLEVDACAPVAGDFSGVVVAEVLEAEQHPNADRLRFCRVKINADEIFNIVCGAANVRAGLKVALAIVGATLPENFKIKRSKIRGIESEGMICSAKELGLEESSEGILELPYDAPLGMDLREYLKLNDNVIDIDFTPNRGDCLSIAGLAREIAALNHCAYQPIVVNELPAKSNDKFAVRITANEACPRYLGRIIKNVDNNAHSPIWLQERLRRSGLRPINPIVDVTNYVMLELGQPLHAFDLSQLHEYIEVRFANPNEKITLLNGETITLNTETLVISDAKNPLAIAGVMGGVNSGVTGGTTNIFLESAFFAPARISGRARQYGLHTDSAYRFERGVDPDLQSKAMERASQLLLEIVGGEICPIVEAKTEEFLPKVKEIALEKNRVEKFLGIKLAEQEITELLERLQMKVISSDNKWLVNVPTYRFDIAKDVDLIEEIARIYGYQNIPNAFPVAPLSSQQPPESLVTLASIRERLVSCGYQEAITYSFVDPKLQELFDPNLAPLALINPISADLSVMRTNLWSGLISAVLYNQRRQQDRVRLFEIGQRFRKSGNDLQQEYVVSGVAAGARYPEQWGEGTKQTDFYDIKADLEALLSLTGCSKDFIFTEGNHPALLPGQTAKISILNEEVGYVGALHPEIERVLECEHPIFLFELNLAKISDKFLPKYNPLSKYPSIRRDIAILVAKSIPGQAIIEVVNKAAGELLVDTVLFDVYQGKGIEADMKSIALGLVMQHAERTLTDAEVNQVVANAMVALKNEFNATLRE